MKKKEIRRGDQVRLRNLLLGINWLRQSLAAEYGPIDRWDPGTLEFFRERVDEIMRGMCIGPLTCLDDLSKKTISTGIYVRTTTHRPDFFNKGHRVIVGHIPRECYERY